jgi:hypothetical protein
VATAIWAAGPRNAWVAETPAVSQQTGLGPAGLILLHWNGSRWATLCRPGERHRRDPGTRSLWAAATLIPVGTGTQKAAILRYHP